MQRVTFLLLTFSVILIFSTALRADYSYTITVVGPAGTSSQGHGINASGQATGDFIDALLGEVHAFKYDGTNTIDLGTPGQTSTGQDINASGVVAGQNNGRPTRFYTGVGAVQVEPNIGTLNAINDSNAAVGTRGVTRTITVSPGGTVTNPYPATNAQGLGINAGGDIVGTLGDGSNPSSGYYDLAGAAPRVSTGTFLPSDLSDGRIASGSVGGVAASYDINTSMTSLFGKLNPSDPFSIARGVSPDGQSFVGASGSSAFIFDSTFGMRSLNSLLDPAFVGWSIINAMDVNDSRQIVGTGIFGGVEQAIVLTPFTAVPEPTSLVGALALFTFYQTRRRRVVSKRGTR